MAIKISKGCRNFLKGAAAVTVTGERTPARAQPITQPPPASRSATAPSGNAENGKKIFAAYGCYQCHGREGQGGEGSGPRIAPRPIPFAAFERYARQPTGQMPPYTAKVVAAQELADIYALLNSRPLLPPVKKLPQLNN
jgi:mono/diheme cytochrome c family protein